MSNSYSTSWTRVQLIEANSNKIGCPRLVSYKLRAPIHLLREHVYYLVYLLISFFQSSQTQVHLLLHLQIHLDHPIEFILTFICIESYLC